MKRLLLLFLLAYSTLVNAQYVVNYKRVADAYFENKDYYAASTFYKKALKITSDTAKALLPYLNERAKGAEERVVEDYEGAIFNLAESSRMYKEFSEAEKYYAIAAGFTNTRYRKAQFYYAASLRANNKYVEAMEAYKKFIQKNPQDPFAKDAANAILSCKYAIEEMRTPRMVQVTKLSAEINGLGSNYGAVKAGNEFYFTSSRPINVASKKDLVKTNTGQVQVSTKTNPFVNSIYKADDIPNKSTVGVKRIKLNLAPDVEVAAPAFTTNGDVMYFSARTGKEKYDIYFAKRTGDNWSTPQPLGLQVNSKDFNSIQPFVTSDGKFLFFSCDKPGGFGKYDIYYCTIREGGDLGQPINVGPTINTADDERAPNYNTLTKTLLFCTDGRIGLGGFDFFESKGDLVNWSEPRNMGYPFNSSKDDAYFTALDAEGNRGYMSSDRESSCCLELFEVKREFFTFAGLLTDCKTKLPLADATATFLSDEGEHKVATNAAGKYSFKLDRKRPVKLSFSKENYFAISKTYSLEEIAKADTLIANDFCLSPFRVNIPIVLDNVYYEFNKAELTESSKTVLDQLGKIMEDNPEMEIELGAHTDDVGTDEYNLDLSNRRAQSCVDYLISKNIAANRMTSKGYGEKVPIASNKTKKGKDNPEGRAKNRRTEFKVTKK